MTRQYYYNLIYLRGLDILYIGPFYFYDPILYDDNPYSMWMREKQDLLVAASSKLLNTDIKGYRIKVYLEIKPWGNTDKMPGYTIKRLPSIWTLLNDKLDEKKRHTIFYLRSSNLDTRIKFRKSRKLIKTNTTESIKTYLGSVKITKRLDRVQLLEKLVDCMNCKNYYTDNWTYVSLCLELAKIKNYLAK